MPRPQPTKRRQQRFRGVIDRQGEHLRACSPKPPYPPLCMAKAEISNRQRRIVAAARHGPGRSGRSFYGRNFHRRPCGHRRLGAAAASSPIKAVVHSSALPRKQSVDHARDMVTLPSPPSLRPRKPICGASQASPAAICAAACMAVSGAVRDVRAGAAGRLNKSPAHHGPVVPTWESPPPCASSAPPGNDRWGNGKSERFRPGPGGGSQNKGLLRAPPAWLLFGTARGQPGVRSE